jgi:hypothetical protein
VPTNIPLLPFGQLINNFSPSSVYGACAISYALYHVLLLDLSEEAFVDTVAEFLHGIFS